MSDRPVGRIVYDSTRLVQHPAVRTAKESERKTEAERKARAERRASMPVPNWITYLNIAFFVGKNIDANGNWLGGKLPPCRRCKVRLQPNENHVCEGYVPQYMEWTDERRAIAEARREAIHETLHGDAPKPWDDPDSRTVTCNCGFESHDVEEAMFHEESCQAGWDNRRCHPLGDDYDDYCEGDDDGWECEEDYVEEDYCEGDDDGLDCD
jgi:hypothetical protein